MEVFNLYDAYFDHLAVESDADIVAFTPIIDTATTTAAENWMSEYTAEKFGTADLEALKKQYCFKYVEGLQWVLHYYLKGVTSWGWYYPFHYAPFARDLVEQAFGLHDAFAASGMADLVEFLDSYEYKFDLGQPFRPFQQLLSVLPPASKDFLPVPYQDLVTSSNSPIIDYYPETFEQDLNLKENDWEAIVLVPFIDQDRILRAIDGLDGRFTPEEAARNAFGKALCFNSSRTKGALYPSSFPATYPDIAVNYATITEYEPKPEVTKKNPNQKDLARRQSPDFPTLTSLSFTSTLREHNVNLFGQARKTGCMVLQPRDPYAGVSVGDFAAAALAAR